MENKRKGLLWKPVVLITIVFLLLLVGTTFFLNRVVFLVELGVLAVFLLTLGLLSRRLRSETARYLSYVARRLSQEERDSLSGFPLPVVVGSATGEIIWYNDRFRDQVMEGGEVFGEYLGIVTNNCTLGDLEKKSSLEVRLNKRRYTVLVSPVRHPDSTLYVLYYIDNTHYKEIAEEYTASRPAVLTVYIDNLEELMQDVRDSERAQMAGKVETLLEDWIGSTTGVLRKCSTDRYVVILEQRHLQRMIESRFEILDRVRRVQVGDRMGVTLSIGVGQGDTLRESDAMARQALEMALGRGGDQAAVKTKNGFDFYGGVSKGVERRTKVRTRVIASALQELIDASENVLVMGHRYSDLDCLGSALGMAAAARHFGKAAQVVTGRNQTLAPELLERYDQAGKSDWFIEPEEAMELLGRHTLLIITDTHNPRMVECPDLYEQAETVVVIDHHRKMVDYIDDAVIFYHEPYASSASEMVAELVQYLGGKEAVGRLEAEGMLAGIMLDTRSFVMKAGVRTFEAAAYLRRLGADTVEVKRLFAGSMDLCRLKGDIVASAQLYGRAAISTARPDGREGRVASAQAADELLSIKGVDASFVLFPDGGGISVSARSLGDFNVQLVMESLGGGGHLTMAGAQLQELSMEQALGRVKEAIDHYLDERKRSLAAQVQPGETG